MIEIEVEGNMHFQLSNNYLLFGFDSNNAIISSSVSSLKSSKSTSNPLRKIQINSMNFANSNKFKQVSNIYALNFLEFLSC